MEIDLCLEDYRKRLLDAGDIISAAAVTHCQRIVKNNYGSRSPVYAMRDLEDTDRQPLKTNTFNRDGTVAVSKTVFWSVDMRDAPVNVKMQLYSIGGIASYGTWNGKDKFYTRWAEAPRVPKSEENES